MIESIAPWSINPQYPVAKGCWYWAIFQHFWIQHNYHPRKQRDFPYSHLKNLHWKTSTVIHKIQSFVWLISVAICIPIKPRLVCKSNPWRPRKLWIKTFNLAKLMGKPPPDGWMGGKEICFKKKQPRTYFLKDWTFFFPKIYFLVIPKINQNTYMVTWQMKQSTSMMQMSKFRFTGPELGHNQIQQGPQPWKTDMGSRSKRWIFCGVYRYDMLMYVF